MLSKKYKWRYFRERDGGPSSEREESPRGKPRRERAERERPPPDLKGRALGLWYRDRRSRGKAAGTDGAEREEQKRQRIEKRNNKPLGTILVSENKKKIFNNLLNQTSSMYPESFLARTTTYEHLEETDFKHEFLQQITGDIMKKLKSSPCTSFQNKNNFEDSNLFKELEQKQSEKSYQEMQKVRKKLPSMGMKDEILELIEKNQVVVISGETGCGKTTQVAQFVLDDYIRKRRGSECKIICTQPRRISAISVAQRVARERDEKLGESVGYQIRLEKVLPRERGSILFCTTGVLLKFMESDPAVTKVSHLILDEIHERDIVSDFLIALLKDVIQYRNDIKIVLMSATLNSEAFSRYYNNAPHINIPGFTHPVEEFFLEDVLQFTGYKYLNTERWNRGKTTSEERTNFIEPFIRQLEAEKKYSRAVVNELRKPDSENLNLYLVFSLIKQICSKDNDDGAILVFVPGFADIQKVCNLMKDSGIFQSWKYIIIPLHSQLPTVDQQQVFNPAPKGKRKIIVSTNIAETSITIDDVTTVIDCGFIKISTLDPETGIETLAPEWVSQANALQRKGRAGRVKPGVCYHLVTRCRYELLDKFLKPEVLRKRLDDVILTLKMLQLGDAAPFLAKLLDPPEPQSVEASLALLKRLGALDDEENLTPLGFHMAKLPVGAHCSKMLIMAALFSCLDPILSIVASLGFKDAFQLSVSESQEADKIRYELSRGTLSDHLCMHYAIRGFEDAGDSRAFCRKYYLSSSILRLLIDMRKQFAQDLFDMKLINDCNPRNPSSNRNSDNIGLIKAVIASGLYPNVAIVRKMTSRITLLRSVLNENMKFHPKSVLNQSKSLPSPLLVYYLRLKSAVLFVHDATVVFPLPIIFFGDQFSILKQTDEEYPFHGVSINGTMRFLCSESTALTIQRLRHRLNQILEWKVSHPGFVDWSQDTNEVKILRVIMQLITSENNEDLDLSDYDDT